MYTNVSLNVHSFRLHVTRKLRRNKYKLFQKQNKQKFDYGLRFEPRQDKTNKVTVRPAKTQISLASTFAVRSMGS